VAGGFGRDRTRTWVVHRSVGFGTRSTPAPDSKTTVEKVQGVELERLRHEGRFAPDPKQNAFLRETRTGPDGVSYNLGEA
jgi:hypothetical protein